MKTLNGNQIVAKYILGYVPDGYVCCVASSAFHKNSKGELYQHGEIYVDGKRFASVPKSLHGGKLPTSEKLDA